jgi:hypothetical protein
VIEEGLALEKTERYRHIRTWYARDRGHTTVAEVVALVERAARRVADCTASCG